MNNMKNIQLVNIHIRIFKFLNLLIYLQIWPRVNSPVVENFVNPPPQWSAEPRILPGSMSDTLDHVFIFNINVISILINIVYLGDCQRTPFYRNCHISSNERNILVDIHKLTR